MYKITRLDSSSGFGANFSLFCAHLMLLLMQDFILLFLKILCHQKCFKTVNETTMKIYSFIFEFHNTKFYIIPLVAYVLK
jgi:hypothetical protein